MDLTRRNTRLDGLPLATVVVLAGSMVVWAASGGPGGLVREALAGERSVAEVAAADAPPETPFGDRSLGETLERVLDPPTRVALAAPNEDDGEDSRSGSSEEATAPGSRRRHLRVTDGGGELLAEGFVRDGVPDGRWLFRHEDGRRRALGEFVGGQPDGVWASWHEDGSPAAELTYQSGQPEGPRVEWWPNGTKRLEGSYHNGLREGLWRRWHMNGVLRSEGMYHAGLREGTWHEWHDNARPYIVAGYTTGRRHGPWRMWYPMAVQAEQGTFVDGLREGMWYFNEANGDRDKRTGYYEAGVRIRD